MGAFVGHHCLPPLIVSASLSPASARNACKAATTCAPSPTAAATRLTDPARTSPIANTPGRLVSSGLRMLAPVRTNPLSSSLTAAAHGPGALLRNSEEEARADPRVNPRGAWPGLPHRRAGAGMSRAIQHATAC